MSLDDNNNAVSPEVETTDEQAAAKGTEEEAADESAE